MRWRFVLYVTGILNLFLGLTMVFPILVGLIYSDGSPLPILKAMGVTVFVGLLFYLPFRRKKVETITQREGMAIVAVGWTVVGLLGALPFYLGGECPFFVDAFRVLRVGSANMNTLISLGVSASFLYSLVATVAPDLVTGGDTDVHVYYEAAAVITTLVLLGRMLEARARASTDVAVRKLIDLQPDVALVIRDGAEVEVRISDVRLGDHLLLRPGSRVPVDGRVLEGETDIDESMLTGEPMPVEKRLDSLVSAGTINLTGSVTFEATRVGPDTALQRIIQLVRSAQGKKPPIQRLADSVSAVFVPTVLVISLFTFAIWMIFGPARPACHATRSAKQAIGIDSRWG